MKNLAVFDFDHTLITGDSFMPFLTFAAGRFATYAALTCGLAQFAWQNIRGRQSESMRTFLKTYLLRRLLKGRSVESLLPAAQAARRWQTENPPMLLALREHAARGDTIMIASGGLDLYLPELLRDMPHNGLICTEIGVDNGVVTGEMIKGNCVRLRKAERLSEWLQMHGPFAETFGYGNYPHDIPMMALLKHRIIV